MTISCVWHVAEDEPMECQKLETYEPQLESPYPDANWSEIDDFTFVTPLRLCRCIEAVQRRSGEDADYIVSKEYTVGFKLDGDFRQITIPEGMITDLASVPPIVRSIIGRVGPHLEATIVHDFLYIAWQDVEGLGARDEDREFADKLLRVSLITSRVGAFRRWLIYNAVRTFGGSAYRRQDPKRYMRDHLGEAVGAGA